MDDASGLTNHLAIQPEACPVTIHYHGLPISPGAELLDLAGKHVCISYSMKWESQAALARQIMQSIMFDNGAFTVYQKGGQLDINAVYRWLEPHLKHPHWAVIPDVIGGDVDDQKRMVATWAFPKSLGAPVWHLGLPIRYLLDLADDWDRICFGSSGEYWKIGSPEWCRRMEEATDALYHYLGYFPWMHGLRMMSQVGKSYPLASVDSVNLVMNFKRNKETPSAMSRRIDQINGYTYPQGEDE